MRQHLINLWGTKLMISFTRAWWMRESEMSSIVKFANKPMQIQICNSFLPFTSSSLLPSSFWICFLSRTSCTRGWYLMGLCLGCFPPSDKLAKYLESYILGFSIPNYVGFCWRQFQRVMTKKVSRLSPPSGLELSSAKVSFPLISPSRLLKKINQ